MSITLLRRMRSHLDEANLLDGYEVRFYDFSDQDLKGRGQVIVFRMPGTGGPNAHVIQSNDVEIRMLTSPDRIVDGDERMLQIVQYLRSDFETAGVFNMVPLGPYLGPARLENNRRMFTLTVRAQTVDH